jgi:hypothetical protein
MHFKIGKKELNKRSKNNKWGFFFASVLVIFIAYHNSEYPAKYNDVLFWSIMGFIILSVLIGLYRYIRYLAMIKDHWVEVQTEELVFNTKGVETRLNTNDIASLTFHRTSHQSRGLLAHIQIKLKNTRGIRLEGYEDLEALGDLIAEQIPKEHIIGK